MTAVITDGEMEAWLNKVGRAAVTQLGELADTTKKQAAISQIMADENLKDNVRYSMNVERKSGYTR